MVNCEVARRLSKLAAESLSIRIGRTSPASSHVLTIVSFFLVCACLWPCDYSLPLLSIHLSFLCLSLSSHISCLLHLFHLSYLTLSPSLSLSLPLSALCFPFPSTQSQTPCFHTDVQASAQVAPSKSQSCISHGSGAAEELVKVHEVITFRTQLIEGTQAHDHTVRVIYIPLTLPIVTVSCWGMCVRCSLTLRGAVVLLLRGWVLEDDWHYYLVDTRLVAAVDRRRAGRHTHGARPGPKGRSRSPRAGHEHRGDRSGRAIAIPLDRLSRQTAPCPWRICTACRAEHTSSRRRTSSLNFPEAASTVPAGVGSC